MKKLALIYQLKIAGTVLFWCAPLILLPNRLLAAAGLPEDHLNLFLRMLGWSYLALCVGYAFGLQAARRGELLKGPIWTGVVSNGGACCYLLYFGLTGTWSSWGTGLQFILWGSVLGTALVTAGLLPYARREPTANHAGH